MSEQTKQENVTGISKGYDPELEVVLCPCLDVLIKHRPHLVYTLNNKNDSIML